MLDVTLLLLYANIRFAYFIEVLCHQEWQHTVMPVPSISQYHIISCNKEGNKYMKENALSKKIRGDSKWEMVTSKSDTVKGDWVLVNYDNKKYPGEVIQIHGPDDIQVSVMVQTSCGHYKWPQPPDSICYTSKEVVQKISPPEVSNSRGFFKFENLSFCK